jgi:hypothetical protein
MLLAIFANFQTVNIVHVLAEESAFHCGLPSSHCLDMTSWRS